MRRIGYVILFLEGIGDAVTTYIGLKAGYEEVFTISKMILNNFGIKGLILVAVVWAFLRVYIIYWYYRRGRRMFSNMVLVFTIIYAGYWLCNNIAELYA